MKTNRIIVVLLTLVLFAIITELGAQTVKTSTGVAQQKWPHPVPARIKDGPNRDMFVMTLGDVTTPIADGIFDPVSDEVKLKDGSVIRNYYRDTLGIRFYKPLDKTVFPVPPSGFCTWYYYYQHITEKEVMLNAKWIADNMKDYGATVVQVDDGWQALRPDGRKGSRDWTGFDDTFPNGMASLAEYIKSLGLTPGIWIAPHGQSNEEVVSKLPGVFILKPDGTSASRTWEGDWLVDPTSPQGRDYLRKLFETMRSWGYEYYKIDGQPIVVNEYRAHSQYMHKPGGNAEELYRETLDIMREAIGEESFLLGCWGMPVEGVGIMNGSRTGGDVVLGWRGGFDVALRPTLQHFYLHNIVWYTDPDVMMLRAPLTLDQARAWATLQGLTGQALLMSDRLPDLSEERVELMRRVYPAVDIRPLDLFPATINKKIWDLKINHLGKNYDVVGLFNFNEDKNETIVLNWEELGITGADRVHVYDFWNKEYMGAFEAGISITVPTTSCRVLTLLPVTGNTELISTSRHITQGWVDLVSYSFDETSQTAKGISNVIKNDPYELTFSFPPGKYYEISSVSAKAGRKKINVRFTNHQGWAVARIEPTETGTVEWSVSFTPAYAYRYETREPANVSVTRNGITGAVVTWSAQYYLNSGYQVFLDGETVGYTGETKFPLNNLEPDKRYVADVRTVWDDGTLNSRSPAREGESPGVAFSIASLLPNHLSLSELDPVPAGAIQKRPARSSGVLYDNTVVFRPGAAIYNLHELFTGFTAAISAEDIVVREGQEPRTAEYEVVLEADGEEVYRSGMIKSGDPPVMVDIKLGKPSVMRIIVTGRQGGATGRGRSGPGLILHNASLKK